MDVLQGIKDDIKRRGLFRATDRVLAAASGGVDSVALARILHACGYSIGIAHVNYGLRGEESDEDERFVEKLARDLNVPFFSIKADIKSQKGSIQTRARAFRYAWLEGIRQSHHFSVIATAHHSDDQIETTLYRMFTRGTGVNGLGGMPYRLGYVARPLLGLRKADILRFVEENGLAYREDRSNLENDYDRNYIRNVVLPAINAHFTHASESLISNMDLWREESAIQRLFIEKVVSKKIKRIDDEYYFPIGYLKQSAFAKTIVWTYAEACAFSSAQLGDILRLMDADNGKVVASASHRFFKYQKWLVLSALDRAKAQSARIDAPGVYAVDRGKISIKEWRNKKKTPSFRASEANSEVVYIDADKAVFPLFLRGKKEGDYFYPLGMTKKKKISRFLMEEKLSISQKEKTYVLESSDKKIIWVVGMRIDDRYKIAPSSKRIFCIKWKA